MNVRNGLVAVKNMLLAPYPLQMVTLQYSTKIRFCQCPDGQISSPIG